MVNRKSLLIAFRNAFPLNKTSFVTLNGDLFVTNCVLHS